MEEVAYSKMDRVVQIFERYPNGIIMVHGFSDTRGRPAYNRQLSQSRADIVCSYLFGKEVPIARIKCMGMNADPSQTRNSNSKRRVEIRIE